MSFSLSNVRRFSRSINNIIMRNDIVMKSCQRMYTIESSREKPSWTLDRHNRYYRPESGAKELDSCIENKSQREVKMMRGEELWWMPDPQTGYYRPDDNCARELDAVDLRSLHFKENKKPCEPNDL